MKTDCQQVLTQFASFSVEELSDSEAASLLHHLEECEPCQGQWLLFEKTLTVVTQSGPHDEDVEQHRSQQMWLVCMEHARQNAAKKSALASHSAGHENQALKSDAADEETSHRSPVSTIPRVGMTVVGGALLMLASSSWLAPRAATADVAAPAQPQIVTVKTVSYAVAPLLDYGAMLGFKSQFAASSAATSIVAPTKKLVFAKNFVSR